MLKNYIPFYKNNLKIALPIVLTQVGGGIVALMDNVMVGHLGAVELASVAFANSIFVLGQVFVMGAVMGLTPLVGQAFVQSDLERVKALFYNALVFVCVLGLAVTLILGLVYPFFDYMGQDTNVVRWAKPYFLLQVFSLLPLLFFCLFKQFLEGLGNTKVAMIITLVANIVNIVLNYLLIYGKFGFPYWGVVGAGVATLISRILMAVGFFVYVRTNDSWWNYLKDITIDLFQARKVWTVARVGMPIGGHMLLECTAFALSAIMVGWLGAVPLAGNQIAQNISHLTFMLVVGIGSATTIRVSHRLGEKNFYALRMAGKASVHLCLLTNTLMAIFMIVFSRQIPRIFTTDMAVIDAAAPLLVLAGLFQISDGLQTVGASILRGLTDVKRPVIYAFISYICINLPLGYLLAFKFHMGASGVWIGFIVGLSIAAILFHVRCNRQINKLEKEMAHV
ncbi:MAG: MATE family efflux transporter [Bacteroidetes bacterium]|uniref:Multidrug-efflux transporter n=1 Tax=Candidatus Gallipaludibacter merdavium TaxID=2840839 RepID=A0A9D9HU67_9BACT|nr:MATE family efflux transporter [Candidatus Gallipaludibacter merdavium]